MAPRKSIELSDYQKRSLEGPESATTRAWVRQREEAFYRWAWARGVAVKAVQFIMGGSALVFVIKSLVDLIRSGTP